MLVFVVDKHTCKIYYSIEGTVIKSLASLGVKHQQIIKGKGYFMWNILLPTLEESISFTKKELITKKLDTKNRITSECVT